MSRNRSRPQMTRIGKRPVTQPVDPDAIPVTIDRVQQRCFKTYPLDRITDNLENRLLDAVPDPLTDLGDPPQPTLAGPVSRADIVGNEQLHHVTVHGT